MNRTVRTLDTLPLGKSASVRRLDCNGDIGRRMMDLGIVPGTFIKALHRSPLGDPTAYSVLGAVIAIRGEDAQGIIISGE